MYSVKCRATSECWRNCIWKKSSIPRRACRVSQRYCPTISDRLSGPCAVSDSTLTFLTYLKITWTIVRTTVQHSDLHAATVPLPKVVVNKWSWNTAISATSWYQNTPHFPSNSLASSRNSMWRPSSLFIPALSFSIWPCRELDYRGYTPLTSSWGLHSSGVCIDVRGVVNFLPWPNPPKIGGTYV